MMRAGSKMPPATCAGCGVEGPAKSIAARKGWQHRGPQQHQRWWCPSCPAPALATTPPIPTPAEPARPEPAPPPTEPFARLRWECDQEYRREMAQRAAEPPPPDFSITAAILGPAKP
jgi:hypothetical protein